MKAGCTMMNYQEDYRKRRWPSKDGFSLVEVMVSVGILVMVIIGLLRLFVYCSVLAEHSGNVTTAVTEIQTQLEEIRNHNFDNIATDYASGGTPGNTFNLTNVNGAGTITISTVGGSSELLQITIVANWQNKDGRSASATLASMIAKR